MCFYYDETPEFYDTSIYKARKDHRCDGCRNGVRKGELYVSSSGKFDGSFFRSATCGACELDRHRIHILELAEGCSQDVSWCPPEELGEMLPEYGMDRSTREAGQQWLQRLMSTGNRGIGTEAGWREWLRDRTQAKELQGAGT